jgi:hypothetical protein
MSKFNPFDFMAFLLPLKIIILVMVNYDIKTISLCFLIS